MTSAVGLVLVALFGICVGSFLNVVIWRLPRDESLVRPRSHCPRCRTPIAWYDNLPVFSWIALRARCRHCRAPIAVRYPLVEALTGGLFVLTAWHWRAHAPTAVFVSVALAAFLAITFIDWEHKIIPDRITKPGIVLAVALAPVTVLHPTDWIEGVKPALSAWLHAGAGAVVGALVILAIRFLGTLAFRKEAMGLGDVKLLALVGALTGPVQVLYALVLACFAGALVGGARWLLAVRRALPLALVVRREGEETSFDAAWVAGETITVGASPGWEPGQSVRLDVTLPAADVLEEEDVRLQLRGRVERLDDRRRGARCRMRVEGATDEEKELLAFFARSRRYVPFGPFLVLGGAVTLFFGAEVHWLIVEGYPRWARGLLG